MTLQEALQILSEHRGNKVVIPTMASIGVWPALSDTPLDFAYMPSSMGQGPAIALGLALARPDRGVIVISGDGSLLMNLGVLVTLASYPADVYLIVMDNQLYEVTGGQPTVGAGRIDFAGLARSAGIERVYRFDQRQIGRQGRRRRYPGRTGGDLAADRGPPGPENAASAAVDGGADRTTARRSRSTAMTAVRTLEWLGESDGLLRLLDQTRLPAEIIFRDCHTVEDVYQAIRSLQVRGAPAIGIAAAYGVVLGTRHSTHSTLAEDVHRACDRLAASRPTAVNLPWALNRMRQLAQWNCGLSADLGRFREALLAEARAIHNEDLAMCRSIGEHGVSLIRDGMGILTHCNAGALAASDYGTALAPVFLAAIRGMRLHVFVDETRPLLQGARLTAWELVQRGVPCTIICDSMAAQVMKEGRVQLVLVGADRIAANGDAANKIGTYGLAVLAKAHRIPFYVAAPSTTFDPNCPAGEQIIIEQRDPAEITHGFGRPTAPAGVAVYNPAFDVTPVELITGFVSERGIFPPSRVSWEWSAGAHLPATSLQSTISAG